MKRRSPDCLAIIALAFSAALSTRKRLSLVASATLALLLACQGPDSNGARQLPTDPLLAAGPPLELAAPSNLHALGSSQTIDIAWDDNASRETGIEVHRSATGSPGSFTLLASLGANVEAYSDQSLALGAQFCYQVRAVRVSGSGTTYSQFSNTACATAAPVATVAFSSVDAGGAHTCALTSGAAYCWGRGESGQLGVPVPASTCMTDAGLYPCSMVPVPVGGGLTFVSLAPGGAHTCALTSDGSAFCWGNNVRGQLGDNSTTNRTTPVAVATVLKFISIDAGAEHTCALTGSGAAYCWGSNFRGQLGDATTDDRAAPVAVSGGLSFQQITAGGFGIGHTCALAVNGDAYCWGANDRGQLGLGAADANPHVPAPVSGGLTFATLSAGLGQHSCGSLTTGAAYCWGQNTRGALGTRSRKDSPIPVPVFGAHTFVQLVAGGFIGHSCGLIAAAAYCWGDNERGQVGDGTTRDRFVPTAVAAGLAFSSIDAGFRHTCGRTSGGTVYCWGANGAGQLGNNSNADVSLPANVFGQP